MAYTAQSDFLLYNEPTMMIATITIFYSPQEIKPSSSSSQSSKQYKEVISMANQIIRDELREQKVYQWELAKALGISESTMVRKMRTEMSDEETTELLALIDSIVLDRKGIVKL